MNVDRQKQVNVRRRVSQPDSQECWRRHACDKRWMGDASAAQVIALVPASRISTIMGGVIGLQPTGIAPRRHIAQVVVNNVENEVPKMLAQKFISLDAAAYLTSYVRGTLDLPPRPREYAFLRHRWNKSSEHGSSGGLVQYNGDGASRCDREADRRQSTACNCRRRRRHCRAGDPRSARVTRTRARVLWCESTDLR